MTTINIKNIGKFIYNYKITNKKYNIICISLFKMKHSYRNFKIYSDGVLEIHKYYKKYFPNFILRIYYDKSVIDDNEFKKLYKVLNENKQQLVFFDCPKFKLDKKYHRGIFGMFMRFIPYFSFKGNDVNVSTVMDAEPLSLRKINLFLKYHSIHIYKFIKSNAYFLRQYRICFNMPWIIKQKDFVLGFYNASKYKFPIKLLTKFLNKDIYNIKKKYPHSYIKAIKYKKNNDSIYWYGSDEFFLTNILKLYLDKHKIKYMTYIKISYKNFLSVLQEGVFKNTFNEKNKKIYYKITKLINKKFNKNFNNVNNIIYYIGNNYDYTRKTDKHKIYEYLRNIIITLYKKYKKLLNINNYKCLLKIDKYYDDTNNIVIT